MKKCACGNEQGRPRVSPFPITIPAEKKTDPPLQILYMGGMREIEGGTGYECWFCAFTTRAV